MASADSSTSAAGCLALAKAYRLYSGSTPRSAAVKRMVEAGLAQLHDGRLQLTYDGFPVRDAAVRAAGAYGGHGVSTMRVGQRSASRPARIVALEISGDDWDLINEIRTRFTVAYKCNLSLVAYNVHL